MEKRPRTTITFCNGSSVPIDPAFIRVLARNSRFQAFVLFCISFFMLTGPYRAHRTLDNWQSASIIFLMSAVVFSLYFLMFAVLNRFGDRLGIRTVHSMWMVLLASIVVTLIGEWSVSLFGGKRLSLAEDFFLVIFYFGIFLGLEVTYGILVLPDVLQQIEPSQKTAITAPLARPLPAEPLADPQPLAAVRNSSDLCVIKVSDKKFLAKCIRTVSSQEHYVSISTFEGEKYFLRGRLRDFLEQIPDELGYCIHRSHWVAWNGIEQVKVANDNMMVYLDDDTVLPVARGRRSDFIERWNRRLSKSVDASLMA